MRPNHALRLAFRNFTLLLVCVFLACAHAIAQATAQASRPVPAQRMAAAVPGESDVIVIMKDQMSGLPATRGLRQSRASAVTASQSAIVARLQSSRPRNIRSFRLLNGFAARVTSAEAAQLASSPEVKAVVADAVIRLPHNNQGLMDSIKAAAAKSSTSPAAAEVSSSGLCNTLEPEALQLTQTAFLNASTPQAQELLDGHGKPVIGTGVKVAFIADGLDINDPGFTRPDGSKVFIDYQDFSGDPAGTPTGGGEAFGDASSIAAQDLPNGSPLLFDLSKFVIAAHPLPSPCNIRIRGVAPGASLVGLKVFSAYDTTESNFIQAIDYAVFDADVDVINESFGGNPNYDSTTDPTSLANHMAVEAGVTVVVSSGDAGTAGTLGSPSTDPYVIAAGASTQFRSYAQTSDGVIPLAKGYVSGNISAFSSAGYAQRGPRTVDIVAPGDSNWALCSTDVSLYEDCYDFNGNPTSFESFGGTSESAPLTSGEAALVIQAYRSTHGGASPSPAIVKRIIMSTATDLGAPSFEQGAGLINTLAAVHAALSLPDSNGTPSRNGDTLVISPSTDPIVSEPGVQHSRFFVVTNTGTTTRHLTPRLQALTEQVAGGNFTAQLLPASSPSFVDAFGVTRDYVMHTFEVTADADHLDAEIAFKPAMSNGTTLLVRLGLLDPSGNQVAFSEPQGAGSGYAHVDVVRPVPGKWTAIIFGRQTGDAYSGPVHLTWTTERYTPHFGSVYPTSLNLLPGATDVVQASFSMPSQPGDSSIALRFEETGTPGSANKTSVPLTLRTLVPLSGGTGDFSGTLTGGNGRGGVGPTQTFEFKVPAGSKGLSLALDTSDPGDLLEGVLVDPNGMQLSVEPSLDPVTGQQLEYVQLFHENPQAGIWRFVLILNYTASGNATSLPFHVHIGLNDVPYTVTGLPDSPGTTLSATAAPIVVPVTVKNTSSVTQTFFADPRLRDRQLIELPQYLCSQEDILPGACIYTYVPPEADKIDFIGQSTVPITMNAENSVGYGVGGTGNPDLYSHQIDTDTVEASLSVPEVPWGYWFLLPSEIGPYGAAGAPTAEFYSGISVKMRPFDSSITSDSGDIYADLVLNTETYNPLVLAPGASGVINLTITPDPTQIGTTIKGFIFLDTFNGNVATGDEVARIPYTYTIVQ